MAPALRCQGLFSCSLCPARIRQINPYSLDIARTPALFSASPHREDFMTKAMSKKGISVLAIGAGALALSLAFAAPASAQTAKTGRTTISKECSAKADEQKLHGKERRKFRSGCIRDAKKKKA